MRYFLLILLFSGSIFGQTRPEFLTNYNQTWVDSVFNNLTLEQKIAQLLMPRGNNSGKGYDPEKLKGWVRDYQIGGIVMFAGQPSVQAGIINELQAMSKVPMLVGMDLEWGLAMRLDSTVRFPYQMSLGAMNENIELIERMGAEIGRQCQRLGVHINYAPVVDININPDNPVINFRSFGEDKLDVTRKSLAYMKGLQSQHIMATAKHFPGHGDTGVDSHYDLPVINHDKARLDDIELYPYKTLIANGLSGIMTAHLSIPALDNTPNLASTMSPKIVTDLLRKELKFEGLTFTDAMDMQGAVKFFPNGGALVKAILAGNDILETFEDVPTAIAAIKLAVETGELSMKILDERVRKVLMAKSWVGLDQYKPTKINSLVKDLNTIESDYLNREMAEKTVTLVKNEGNLLPIKDLQQKIAIVSVDALDKTVFQKMSDNYTDISHFQIPVNASDFLVSSVHEKVHDYDLVIVALHLQSIRPYSNYGINQFNQFALDALLENDKTVVVIFGNPYSLGKLNGLEKAKAIVMANQLTDYMEDATAQAVFGAIPFMGHLPVTVNEKFKVDDGIFPPKLDRLAYGIPEQVGIDSRVLNARIDSIANQGLTEKAYPGSVVEIAKDGRVVYWKAFGYHTYEDAEAAGKITSKVAKFEKSDQKDAMDNHNPFEPDSQVGAPQLMGNTEYKGRVGQVRKTDLYDMASVTKVSTSALAVMQLISDGKFDLDKTFGDYYPPYKGTNKENVKFRDMLTHRSGLKPFIPFWQDCVDTLSTINKGLMKNPALLDRFTYFPQEKVGFFKRLFGKKQLPKIDYLGSISKDKKLWADLLSTETITWKPGIFANRPSADYTIQITDTLWEKTTYKDFIIREIGSSPLKPEQGYVYSDMHYYLYPEIIPGLTGMQWEDYLKKTYKSLGANSLTYNPRRFYALDRIVPTEYDALFRKILVHGRVHDEGASMLNGISGHAGLFGNSNDLTKLMQMYLQKGSYGGVQFIKPEVVEECTRYQFNPLENRRAIAFDKLHPDKKIANGPQMASASSYGHSGYTGTFTWVDPESNSVYVFLCNRVYPTRDNGKVSELNIRTQVGNMLYKTINGE